MTKTTTADIRDLCMIGVVCGRHPVGKGFRFLMGRAYDDKTTQEQLIKESQLDWTIVRPGILTNTPGRRDYKILTEASEWRNGIISRADVADFLVRKAADRQYVGRAPVLVG